ncbi:MAG: DUF58 domain-containing protein, partial [Candidatus Sumerlaeota bacterium]
MLVDTSSRAVRETFEKENRRRQEEQQKLFRKLGLDNLEVRTDRDYLEPLVQFFKRRAKRY